MSDEQTRGNRRPRPDRFDSTQRTAAIVLLSLVVPIIGYLLYIQWIGPAIEARQTPVPTSSALQDALITSQIQATARAEVWATITTDARGDEEVELLDILKATAMIEARETLIIESEATAVAEAQQQATLSAVETQSAFNMLAMEGTVSSQVRATSNAIAGATISAYQAQQDGMVDIYVLGTVQTLYEGDLTRTADTFDERTTALLSTAGAFLVGGAAVFLGVSYLTRASQPRRKRADKQLPTTSQYVSVQCQCQAQQVLCHQCDGTGEVLYTDTETNRYMYRYCPRCNGTGYTDCDICSGRGQYYKEAKAIEMPVEEPQPPPVATARNGWSTRMRAFLSTIDQIASNQRADS